MKKITLICFTLGLSLSANVHAEGWLDSIKSALGFETTSTEQAPQLSAEGLLSSLTSNLGVNSEQAEGGLASLFNYAKNNVSSDTFSSLTSQIPGIDGYLSKLPDTSNLKQDGISGLLEQAAQYSDSLKSINELKSQFEALGLDTDMILKYVSQMQAYLDTEEGQNAKQLLTQSFSSLSL
ncbi:DUF2780 domain-containing protein [Alteromonas sp. 5E99-2]|uniref:DUF2780 domain-containing protein n=1 Tax=Alteromonas sp. 5E99-2 TaxID=2817683 RepID=UPI001A9912F8|nr:DUF2780 domain-containing protein [Alteromonas sp. 5E99-2]MBO1256113.1 DUF2780 domain-containing protein [Alteromonas sp. 5E99-2]